MDLSIVIPAYNEQKKISRDILDAAIFLDENEMTGEIIVVDDGSTDRTAEEAENTQILESIPLKVDRYEKNRGKGYAVRRGIQRSAGKIVMFADSGSCVPYSNTLLGLNLIEMGECDIAHGSRKMGISHIKRGQSWFRKLLSTFFHWFMIYYMKIPAELTDTQCGFKIYRGDIAREIYAETFTDGFTFDIEVILRALHKGLVIREFPVDWTCDPDSRLSVTRSYSMILTELINIKRTLNKQQNSGS